MTAVGVAAAATADAGVQEWGPVRLPQLVPWAQLLPLVAAVGVAAALAYQVDSSIVIDDRAGARLRRWRLPWALAATATAWLACSMGALRGVAVDVPTTLANLLLLSGLAMGPVALGAPALAWLPPSALFLAAALFGYPEGADGDEFYWWASLLSPAVSPARLGVSAAVWALGTALYVRRLPRA